MIFQPFPDNDITQEERIYIIEIQEKLRALELIADSRSDIPVDGVYGPFTTAAVKRFQQRYGLPVTGITDRNTYAKLTEVYDDVLQKNRITVRINGFTPSDGIAFRTEERGDGVYFLNIMLSSIGKVFQNIPPVTPSDTFTAAGTLPAVRALQDLFRAPVTGIVDRQTWNRITDLYNDLIQDLYARQTTS